jgi:hypothetical protein
MHLTGVRQIDLPSIALHCRVEGLIGGNLPYLEKEDFDERETF